VGFSVSVVSPRASISSSPELHVDRGSTIHISCFVHYSVTPTTDKQAIAIEAE
jgi:hypothetical protein